MKNHYTKFISSYFLSLILFSFLMFSSCSKFIKIDEPVDRITTNAIFTNEATATSAVMGLYAKVTRNPIRILSGATTVYGGFSSDELYPTGTVSDYLQFYNNAILETSGVVANDFWSYAYDCIYQANVCIEGLQNSQINTALRDQLLGELLTIRALHYWYLTNLFGDVPLLLTSDFEENSTTGRTVNTHITEQIISDLEMAYELLQEQYFGSDRERINKWTAAAFLARVYLYQKNWTLAQQYASDVIIQSQYKLEENLNKVFLIESEEIIWRMVERNEGFGAPSETSYFIPVTNPSRLPLCTLTEDLLNAFEPGDKRLSHWTSSRTVGGIEYIYPFKFKDRYRVNGLTEALNPFRLAEMYLIRSEARAQLNDISGGVEDLNTIRNRSDLENKTTTNKEELLDLILKERRIEFFAEWGHRWFDLKRTGKIDEILGEIKPNWKATASLWPIPYNQRFLNLNLTQNEGYEQ